MVSLMPNMKPCTLQALYSCVKTVTYLWRDWVFSLPIKFNQNTLAVCMIFSLLLNILNASKNKPCTMHFLYHFKFCTRGKTKWSLKKIITAKHILIHSRQLGTLLVSINNNIGCLLESYLP